MKKTAELVLDEFDKVEAIEKRADEALAKAAAAQKELLTPRPARRPARRRGLPRARSPTLRQQRGQLITLKELRGDRSSTRVAELEDEVAARFDEVSKACVAFFLKEDAFKPLVDRLDAVVVAGRERSTKAAELAPFAEELDVVQQGLTLLAEVVGGLKIDDATARTRILEGVSTAFAQQNRARAVWQGRKKELSVREGAPSSARSSSSSGRPSPAPSRSATRPRRATSSCRSCSLSLEELEGKFGELDEFTGRPRAEARGGQRRDRRQAPAARSTSATAARRT